MPNIRSFVLLALLQATSFTPPNQRSVLSFDGLSTGGSQLAVAPPASMLQLGNAFTMETWIFLTAASPGAVIMGRTIDPRGADPSHHYVLGFEGSGQGQDGLHPNFVQSTGAAGTYRRIQAEQGIALRTWTHLAAELDSGIMRLYVNGVEVARGTSPGPPAGVGTAPFAIGAAATADNRSAGSSIRGALRQVRVWSRALSPQELQTRALNPISGSEPGLVASWPLDEGTGSIARDAGPSHLDLNWRIVPQFVRPPLWAATQLLESGPYWEIQDLPKLTEPPNGAHPSSFLNADQRLDLLLAYSPSTTDRPTSGPVLFLHNEGKRVFTPVTPPQPSMVTWPRNDAVADFDGDGYEDVVVADHGFDAFPFPGGTTRIFMQRSGKMSDETNSRLAPGPAFTHDICSADVNRDGSPDLYFGNMKGSAAINGPILYLNDGKGHFRAANELLPSDFRLEIPPTFLSCQFADVNRDGSPDLLLGTWGNGPNGRDWLLLNDGNGNLRNVSVQSMPPKRGGATWATLGFAVADVDRDGWPDLIATISDASSVTTMQLLINNRDGTFHDQADAVLNVVRTDGWYDKAYALDFNRDGWLDLFVNEKAGDYGGVILLYQNIGGHFEDRSETLLGAGTGQLGVRPADFDGDGRIDIPLFSGNNVKIAWGANLWPAASLPVPGVVSLDLGLFNGGGGATQTISGTQRLQVGYARVDVKSGAAPYGTAVFSVKNGDIVIGEVGVPASPPTAAAGVFIEYRVGTSTVSTGVAVVNPGLSTASVTYELRGLDGGILAVAHGTVAAGSHFAKFVDQFADVAPDFVWVPDFAVRIRFATLEIISTQPLSIVALRQTLNQRNEALFTTTPVTDLTVSPSTARRFIPIIADGVFAPGNFYSSTLALLNTSAAIETGTIAFFDPQGKPLVIQPAGGPPGASFRYQIRSHGGYILETTGAPKDLQIGSVQIIPDPGGFTPVGAAVVRISYAGVIVSEFGAPAVLPTNHALIYVDKSGQHDTGIAVAAPDGTALTITARAFQTNGITPAGTGQIMLEGLGQKSAFAGEIVTGGVPTGFTGVLDISSPTPFVALTLRTLLNQRGEFLMTAFPVADLNQPAPTPIIFPQIVDGPAYRSEVILLSAGGASFVTVRFLDETGAPLSVGNAAPKP